MEPFADIARLAEEGTPFVIATVIDTRGSTPQKPGTRVVVLENGQTFGTIGGGAIEKQVVDAALELFGNGEASTRVLETHLTHDLGMCCGGTMRVFLERHGAPARLHIFGAGHVAKELASTAQRCGFRVRVIDERAELANPQRFPECELVLQPPADVARALNGTHLDFACITTHDHALDQACVEALLRKPLAYLGVIGSRRKAERFRMRLVAAGFTPGEIERLHCPMGVLIKAATPAEIGVSIASELIAVRRGRST